MAKGLLAADRHFGFAMAVYCRTSNRQEHLSPAGFRPPVKGIDVRNTRRIPLHRRRGQSDRRFSSSDGRKIGLPHRERRYGLLRRHSRSDQGSDGDRRPSSGRSRFTTIRRARCSTRRSANPARAASRTRRRRPPHRTPMDPRPSISGPTFLPGRRPTIGSRRCRARAGIRSCVFTARSSRFLRSSGDRAKSSS
jgi:hypothetical protein